MNLQKAVVITTDSSLCEVEMDGNFDAAKLIGCQGISALVSGYFELFTGPPLQGVQNRERNRPGVRFPDGYADQ